MENIIWKQNYQIDREIITLLYNQYSYILFALNINP